MSARLQTFIRHLSRLPVALLALATASPESVADEHSSAGKPKPVHEQKHVEKHGEPETSASPATEHDSLFSTNLVRHDSREKKGASHKDYKQQVDSARQFRRDGAIASAEKMLVGLLEGEAPAEFKRAALFEIALVAQEQKQFPRAQQILAQYIHLYPEDPTVPEVLLRQGLIYRQMGAHNTAIGKFYAVMNSALGLKLEQFDYYQRLVLQAQTEIADTYYIQGKFTEAADFFVRILKQNSTELNRPQIHYKLIRCYSGLGRHKEVITQCESFFEKHADAVETPELRFICATSLRQTGRLGDALRQVMKLLESQESTAGSNPENWLYWQQRAGNDIANQLYLEGDYLNALEVYSHLANLNHSAVWQLPLWYQAGLIYERLLQPKKAVEKFDAVLAREKEAAGTGLTPALKTVIEMARWRKEQITWRDRAEVAVQALHLSPTLTASTNVATPKHP